MANNILSVWLFWVWEAGEKQAASDNTEKQFGELNILNILILSYMMSSILLFVNPFSVQWNDQSILSGAQNKDKFLKSLVLNKKTK